MKAELDATGVMTIIAETQLESYALIKWLEDNSDADCGNMQFKWIPRDAMPNSYAKILRENGDTTYKPEQTR